MGQDSKIEWCHATFNPWRGCTKVSEACRNCYAEVNMSVKLHGITWGPKGDRVVKAESGWNEPLRWNAAAAAAGERHRVFCGSLADVFEGPETMPAKSVGAIVTARARLIDLIDRTPNLDWLLLTKRPENVVRLWNEAITEWADPGSLAMPLPNVWIGTSVEDQKTADERIPHLLKIPAAVRFLSCEPLLGPINFEAISYTVQPGYFGDAFRAIHRPGTPNEISKLPQYPGVSWVIVGGESGPHARPMHADWARSIRDQCVAAGVPFHFKQWGQWMPGMLGGGCDTHYRILYRDGTLHEDAKEAHLNVIMPKDQRPNPDAGAHVVSRVGKKAAGRLLDGRTWDEFPNVPVTPAPA